MMSGASSVLLVDAGGPDPKLSLMKYARYYRDRGARVVLKTDRTGLTDPDLVICTVVFSEDRYKADALKWSFPSSEIVVGGPGYEPQLMLPQEVDGCKPDYSIYDGLICQQCGKLSSHCHCTKRSKPGDMNYSLGRVTIGCIRSCYFCVVPEMGRVRYVQPVWDFYRSGKCRFLDDNIFALRDAWNETAEWLIETGVQADFDALDIRLVDEEIAGQLCDIKHERYLHFAFDMLSYTDEVLRGIQLLKDAGMTASRLMFYVYLDDEANISSAQKRWEILKREGVLPYLMVNKRNFRPDMRSSVKKRFMAIRRRGDAPAINRKLSPAEVFE